MTAGSDEDRAREQARESVESGFLSEVADRIGSNARVSAVFGDPVEHDGVTVIPVAKAAWGVGGGGGGSEEGEGFGAGGGMKVRPHGYIELSGGRARYRPLRRPLVGVLAALGAAAAGAGAAAFVARLRG